MSDKNNNDANFNDSELQDIMAEIESLEQDQHDEKADHVAESAPEDDQEAEEVHAEDDSDDYFEEDTITESELEEEPAPDNVSYIEAKEASLPKSGGPMEFHGKGSMDFEMNFPIGSEHAELQVQDGTVTLVFGEIRFSISEDGCKATMPGGASFSVPTHKDAAAKKAA